MPFHHIESNFFDANPTTFTVVSCVANVKKYPNVSDAMMMQSQYDVIAGARHEMFIVVVCCIDFFQNKERKNSLC